MPTRFYFLAAVVFFDFGGGEHTFGHVVALDPDPDPWGAALLDFVFFLVGVRLGKLFGIQTKENIQKCHQSESQLSSVHCYKIRGINQLIN